MMAKHIIGKFSRFFEGASTFLNPKLSFAALRKIWGSKSLGPLEKPLEIADYVFCPHEK
jgi:hypothetical protein